MTLTDPFLLLLLMVGPFVGSFLGVLTDRLPRGQGVVAGRSACRSCGTPLTVRDLMPILSFILTRGRCRHCGAVIPSWLLYLEIAATGAAVLSAVVAPTALIAWLWALWLWVLLTSAACDLTRYRLPDPLTGALVVIGLTLAVMPEGTGLMPAVWGAIAGGGSFAIIRWGYRILRNREGLGLGDVKLMVGLGAWTGVRDLPLLVLLAALAALAGGLGIAALGRGRGPLAQRALPFGAALCGAAIFLWVIRRAAI